MVKVVITDLDGTILPRSGTISTTTLEALEKCGARGITRVIATGRNLFASLKVLPEGFPIDYLVFSSGAGVMRWQGRKLLSAEQLEEQEVRHIAEYLWDFGINFTIQREIPDNHLFYYTDIYPVHEDFRQRLECYRGFGEVIGYCGDIRGRATQFVMILDVSQIRLVEQIRRDLRAFSVIRTTSPVDNQAIWLEIFPKGVNKGSCCLQLLQQLGVNPEDCAGIGNDYNDVDFLDLCGEAFLVANAPILLKPHYKTVARDVDNGFCEFIGHVCR